MEEYEKQNSIISYPILDAIGKLLGLFIQLIADVSELRKLIHYTKSLGSALCVQDTFETDDTACPHTGTDLISVSAIERFAFSESRL